MKSIKLIAIILGLLFAGTVQAQVTVTTRIGSPPPWGPAGYTEVRYYYLPDVEAFYDVQSSQFIYYGGGVWVRRANLPARYSNYDLYDGYKVVMTDYHGKAPYTHYKTYKAKYAKGYRGPSQKTIGNKPGNGNQKAKAPSKAVSKKSGKASPANNKSSKGGHGGGKGKKK